MSAPHAKGETVHIASMSFSNDVGGTERWQGDPIAVEIVKPFANSRGVDGWRYIGKILDPSAIEAIRALGTTGLSPEDYRKYEDKTPGIVAETESARQAFDPSMVNFDANDVVPAPAPRP